MNSAEAPVDVAVAIPPSTHLTAGALSGAFAASVTQPLDVVKTRMQAEPVERRQLPRYTGVRQALRVIATEEGARGLFVGLAPSVLALVPALSSFFTVYTSTKRWAFGVDPNGRGDTPLASGVSAGTAWVVTAMLTNPLWVVRTRIITQILREGKVCQQSSTSPRGMSIVRATQGIVREEGFRGLYRGTAVAMAGFPAASVQFALYEPMKSMLLSESSASSPPNVVCLAVASSVSSFVSQMVCFPLEVVRTRIQSGMEGPDMRLFALIRRMLARKGLRSFYRGLMPSMLRTVPNSAAALVSYEFFLSMLT
ncbi:hypothetical protein CDCA_CDCA14G3857 [Cyanidium caldarium]|uniref:Mitochondrial carrier protein n=1 Tax=Cyanidium caldarium TaxID=2771 RepID=A0AAV9IZU6_CYACA|nr:hypothetical protein CDCA_CDCA14G3857 [Cyanidium caldarium]